MSKTRKGSKGPGCDLWSRRPGGSEPNTKANRQRTVRRERTEEAQLLHQTKRRTDRDETGRGSE